MRESTDRVQVALHGSNSHEQLVATRILENPAVWQKWEGEHSTLLHEVMTAGAAKNLNLALKRASFRLIHRKALFEFLRDQSVRGPLRADVLAHFRTGQHYEDAVIAEHRVYLRKACSFLCTNHLGLEILQDAGFLDPVQHYEDLYAEYFDLYCRVICGALDPASSAQPELLPLLKHQLEEWRNAILNPRESLPRLLRDAELRRPTGDTQRNRILGPRPRRRR
ncbi:MAG: hypothetical protein ACLQJ0_10040 [Steroidobacteraceae bacterium]|jgi:hypothetical protein